MAYNSVLSEFGDDEFQKELVSTFIAEAREHLNTLETSLLSIEDSQNQDKDSAVYEAMRAAHSLKGSASMLGFKEISSFAHKVEDLLSFIRETKTNITQEMFDVLYHSKDLLNSIVDSLDKDAKICCEDEIKVLENNIESLLKKSNETNQKDEEEANQEPQKTEPQKPKTPIPKKLYKSKKDSEIIRISMSKVNEIINLSTEMHIKYLNILNFLKNRINLDEQYIIEEFGKMLEKMQENSIKMRMKEIDSILSKFKRIVRDVAKSQNKEVSFEVEGGDVEIDKTILEKIEDPLKHMIRNSIDHGIEPPEEREDKGKPREGKILVKSYYLNGQVRIEISDDGAGLDKEKIRIKAVENGLIKDDDELSDDQIYNLIFHPGLTTAEKLSEISGRGVGMDVVKKNISSIHGTIAIKTEKDKGTTFIMDIPLTLSIIHGTYVKIKGNVFILSNKDVEEFVSIKDLNISKSHSNLHASVEYRGSVIPVIDISKYLGLEEDASGFYGFVAILKINDESYGIYIDEPLESEQMVIKSVDKNYKIIDGVLGAGVYENGILAPILDMKSVIKNFI